MSQATKRKSGHVAPSSDRDVQCARELMVPQRTQNRRVRNLGKISFLRLFEDVVDELNKAVRLRISQGASKGEIAERGGMDPAVLSRTLRGRAGTNLRTVAAVLAGTDHRFRIVSVPCEDLQNASVVYPSVPIEDGTYHYVLTDGVWQEPLTEGRLPEQVHVYSTGAHETPVDA